jgi:hypothetical protein
VAQVTRGDRSKGQSWACDRAGKHVLVTVTVCVLCDVRVVCDARVAPVLCDVIFVCCVSVSVVHDVCWACW